MQMSMLASGIYSYDEDSKYDFEVSCHLRYLIASSLFDIDGIFCEIEEMQSRFENKTVYYHYLVDDLFVKLGLINERLVPKKNCGTEKPDRINSNIKNNQFDQTEYPILSNKKPRNLIEHIDDRAQSMLKKGVVGGFNVIFTDSSCDLIEDVMNHRDMYPIILNMADHTIMFYDINEKEKHEYEISLDELRAEVEKLRKNVDIMWRLVAKRMVRDVGVRQRCELTAPCV